MRSIQKKTLFYLKEAKKEKGMTISILANKLNTKEENVLFEIDGLLYNKLIEVSHKPSGKIKFAKITPKGEEFYLSSLELLNKEDISKRIEELEKTLEDIENSLRDQSIKDNKSLLTKFNELQTAANGTVVFLKSLLEFASKF